MTQAMAPRIQPVADEPPVKEPQPADPVALYARYRQVMATCVNDGRTRYDSNGNGVIDTEAEKKAYDPYFSRCIADGKLVIYDLNHNGVIDADEQDLIVAGARAAGGAK